LLLDRHLKAVVQSVDHVEHGRDEGEFDNLRVGEQLLHRGKQVITLGSRILRHRLRPLHRGLLPLRQCFRLQIVVAADLFMSDVAA
jgi:hypothetical protein